jgi:hypothetical protein
MLRAQARSAEGDLFEGIRPAVISTPFRYSRSADNLDACCVHARAQNENSATGRVAMAEYQPASTAFSTAKAAISSPSACAPVSPDPSAIPFGCSTLSGRLALTRVTEFLLPPLGSASLLQAKTPSPAPTDVRLAPKAGRPSSGFCGAAKIGRVCLSAPRRTAAAAAPWSRLCSCHVVEATTTKGVALTAVSSGSVARRAALHAFQRTDVLQVGLSEPFIPEMEILWREVRQLLQLLSPKQRQRAPLPFN